MENNKNNPLTFRMCLSVKFNREIVPDVDYVSPGGYEMVMNGKNVQFDFEDYEGSVDNDDKTIVDCCMCNPDYDSFSDLLDVTRDDLSHISDIIEAYVYVDDGGNGNNEPLAAKEIVAISFYIPETDEQIEVSQNVIDKYNKDVLKRENKWRELN